MDTDALMKAFSEFLDKRSIKRPLTDLIKYNRDKSIVYTTKRLYDLSLQISSEIYGKHDPLGAQFLRIIWIYSTLYQGEYGGYAGIRKSVVDNRLRYRNSRQKKETAFQWKEYWDKGVIGYVKSGLPDKDDNRGRVNQFGLSNSTYDRFHPLTEEERRCSDDEIVGSQFGDLTLTSRSTIETVEKRECAEEVPIPPQTIENTGMSDSNMLDVWHHESSERFFLARGIEEKLTHWTVTHNKLVVPFLRLHKAKLLDAVYNGNFQRLMMDAVLLSNIIFEHRDELLTRTLNISKDFLVGNLNLDQQSFNRLATLAMSYGMGVKLVCIEGFDDHARIVRDKNKAVIDYQHQLLSGQYRDHPDVSAIGSIIEIYPRLIKGKKVTTRMGWLIRNGVIDRKYNGAQYDDRLQKLAIDLGLDLDLSLREVDIVTTNELPKEQVTDEETQTTDHDRDEHTRIAEEHGWTAYEQLTDEETQRTHGERDRDGIYKNRYGDYE